MADIHDMRLDITKCPMCGRAFVGVAGSHSVCDDCREDEQLLYSRLRALIRDNRDTRMGIDEAARRLHVEEKKIRYFVDKGLVQISGGSLM